VPGFRAATAADAHGIAVVTVTSWRAAYRGLLPDGVLDGLSVPERERTWAGTLADPPPRTGVVVAEDGGGIVGFAAVGPSPDDPALGQLFALYLVPAAFGTGVGHDLHAAALDRLRAAGFTDAVLWVLRTNARALRFYHREGWSPTGRTAVEPGPGGAGLDVAMLRRPLGPPAGTAPAPPA
jgi:GNAT superfamily N-acetyltransferase